MLTVSRRNLGFRVWDCGCSPACPSSNPKSRAAISLTEVLIAMGILTLGLLGVASLFPVGGYYMQKATVADNGSAIAQSVMNDIVARGLLNPQAWFVSIPWTRNPGQNLWNSGFPSDGQYLPSTQRSPVPAATFTRPLAEALNDGLSQSTSSTDKTLLGKQFGSAYVIDPLGVAVMALPARPTQSTRNGPAVVFPAAAFNAVTYTTTPGSFYFASNPYWSLWSGGVPLASAGLVWPIRRVTFRQQSSGWQLGQAMAEHISRCADDLVADLPQRADRPAAQPWDISNGSPMARQWTGDYSWIATVVPTTTAARNAISRSGGGFAYDVSVVVFYKRPLPTDASTLLTTTANLTDYQNSLSDNERLVKASIQSTGINGGEILLTDIGDMTGKNPFEGLKAGQWIMLCGPHPNSSTADPKFALNWYQVIAIDKEGEGITNFDPTTQRVVTVRGSQWPWQPRSSYPTSQQNSDVATLSDYLCVGICRGAVAVHTKTLRLESTSGNSGGSVFGGATDPTTTTGNYRPG